MFDVKDFSFIHKYFIAQKQESLLLIIIGLLSIVVALNFWFFMKKHHTFYKGMAIPLLAIGLIQSISGIYTYKNTNKQRLDVAYKMGIDPKAFANQEELPRMKKQMNKILLLHLFEFAGFLIGLGLLFFNKSNKYNSLWYGIAIGLVIQTVILLTLNFIESNNAKKYTSAIEKFI